MDTFLILFHLVIFLVNAVSSQNVIEKFIQGKLEEFPSWLKLNNLDPSVVVDGPTDTSFTTPLVLVKCNLRYHWVANHSTDINILSVKANLDTITVSFAMKENVTFTGEYNANGTTWSGNLSGEGNFYVRVPGLVFENFSFNYSVSSGHINITSHDLSGILLPSYDNHHAEVVFENLWDDPTLGDDVERIKDTMYGGFREYLIKDLEHPLRKMYLQYFREVFMLTRWADIILPNPITTTISTTTTEASSAPASNSTITVHLTKPKAFIAIY